MRPIGGRILSPVTGLAFAQREPLAREILNATLCQPVRPTAPRRSSAGSYRRSPSAPSSSPRAARDDAADTADTTAGSAAPPTRLLAQPLPPQKATATPRSKRALTIAINVRRSSWVIDDAPETGEGFEAAVALAVAKEMGYEGDAVVWTRTTFDEAIQPGPKTFDMNLQQYSITPERQENVDMSLPYYTSNQAMVGLDGSAAAGATTVADLRT
jgi:polar amino acid transport system substrate-binding protein